jgi:hypothetical protein
VPASDTWTTTVPVGQAPVLGSVGTTGIVVGAGVAVVDLVEDVGACEVPVDWAHATPGQSKPTLTIAARNAFIVNPF